jgi:hypothetical protein
MSQIGSDIPIAIMYDFLKGESFLSKKQKPAGDALQLVDTPRTWFLWNQQEYTVRDAPSSIFDAWITHYADVSNVDRARWEIFRRWDVLNVCLDEEVLTLRTRPDGSQILEEASSTSEANVEEPSSARK